MGRYTVGKDSKTVQGHTTYFIRQQNQLVAEINADGKISIQYLYFNEGQHSTPIAKLDADDTYFIHTDHHAAPIAMTDANQHIVWKANISEWGRVTFEQNESTNKKQSREHKQVTLNIRLPGQYYDEETGLHDNWHRTYNPGTGRYLQPDPIGYRDGPDAYIYAQGDPLNKIDPTGLYQIDMHYYMVFFLALASGLDTQVARSIALASQYIDDNPLTTPVNTNVNGEVDVYASITTNQTRLQYYHFMADTLDKKANIHTIMDGNQLYNLYNAYLNASDGCAKQSFFGETLHALADTYSHAKTDDTPYRGVDLGMGIGHGLNDSDPDYTFNHWGYSVFVNKLFPGSQPNANNGGTYWGTNADRTLSAEQAMFDQFTQQTTWSRSSDHDFLSVLETLIEFNKTGESEQYDFSWDDQGNQTRTKHAEVNHGSVDSINAAFSKKLDILDAALEEMGINVNLKDPAWAYNESLAADNRTKALGSLSCDEKSDAGEFKYAGTILPSKACPRPPNP